MLTAMLKELNRLLMFRRGCSRLKRTEISALVGFGILLA